MRINVYAEELTDREPELLERIVVGGKFYGCRVYLKSPGDLTAAKPEGERDSAVTFWFTTEAERLGFFRRLLDRVVSAR